MDLLIEIVIDFVFYVLLEIPIVCASILALGIGLLAYKEWPFNKGQIDGIAYGSCATVFLGAGLWLMLQHRRRIPKS